MAIDTASKRFSISNMKGVATRPFIVPDGSIDAGDRYHRLGLYFGIALGSSATITTTLAFTTDSVTFALNSTITRLWSEQSPASTSWTEQSPDSSSWTEVY